MVWKSKASSVVLAAMLVMSTMGIGLVSAATLSAPANQDDGVVHANGDDVYIVFGADTSSTDLKSWVEEYKNKAKTSSQESSSQVLQYQDVQQLNVNQQGNSVAISIDGGKAEAIQRTYQDNTNTQTGVAQSVNAKKKTQKKTFKDVKNVYVIFAGETGSREFSGWVVSDSSHESKQSADAHVDQYQDVDQLNYNNQSTAVAVAEGGSYARAYQRSYQSNTNVQDAEAVAANVGDGDNQSANSSVWQYQNVSQLNVNQQGVAVAIAVGEGSVAKAWQVSCQFNTNKQIGKATAINFDPKSVEEVTASADMQGDFSDSDVKRTSDDGAQSNSQNASANVSQFQNVSQQNINLQDAAVAIALNDSQATATQVSYQANFNAQIASANAVNLKDGNYEATTVLNGTDVKGDGSWAVSYDDGDEQVNEQHAIANITQVQYVEQLNVNEQYSAVAFATNGGCANAEQVNYQVNENVQVAESNATNTDSQDDQQSVALAGSNLQLVA
ncbi:hypothetical protein [Haladaptatus salinisoli]|uniref:hypothetical protein n=1 Tax=Haladaptatus salinisoli TaxID=2884876 RepID=UPI001D0A212A|nr:hypothetical protein [Haladaptatus salinisoli]